MYCPGLTHPIDDRFDLKKKESSDNQFNNYASQDSNTPEKNKYSVGGTNSHIQPTNVTYKKNGKSDEGNKYG